MGQGPYVQVITLDGRKNMSFQSMSKLEEILPDNFRIHRPHIIKVKHIEGIDGERYV